MKIDFFVVGAAKSGTTSLHTMLSETGRVSLPKIKETNFFSLGVFGRPCFTGPLDNATINKFTVTSNSEYEKQFSNETEFELFGEICPSYFAIPGTAKRIHDQFPDAKIVIVLRNPCRRAYSNYTHLVRDGRESLSFRDAFLAGKKRIEKNWEWFWDLERNSLYFDSAKEYLDLFAENVMFVKFEDLIESPDVEFAKICRFVGLQGDISKKPLSRENTSGMVNPKFATIHKLILSDSLLNRFLRLILPESVRVYAGSLLKNRTVQKIKLSNEDFHWLKEKFKGDIDKLEDLTGIQFNFWKPDA